MREVDEALARAFARRDAARPGFQAPNPSVPPAPHLDPARFEGAGPSWEWPRLVLTLERDCGERFEALAEALARAKARLGFRAVLFTSCHRAEGRTTLVLCLGRALARRPGRALIVDLDLTGPMVARQLNLRPRFGLDDVIESGTALADAVIPAPGETLSVLPLRAAPSDPRRFTSGGPWAALLARLRREYDWILLDGGPLFLGVGATVVPGNLDAAVLVHNKALTGRRALARGRKALAAAGLPVLGLAETFVS